MPTKERCPRDLVGLAEAAIWRSAQDTLRKKYVTDTPCRHQGGGQRTRGRIPRVMWQAVANPYLEYARRAGTPSLLASLALGRVTECSFPPEQVALLKKTVIENQAGKGL